MVLRASRRGSVSARCAAVGPYFGATYGPIRILAFTGFLEMEDSPGVPGIGRLRPARGASILESPFPPTSRGAARFLDDRPQGSSFRAAPDWPLFGPIGEDTRVKQTPVDERAVLLSKVALFAGRD